MAMKERMGEKEWGRIKIKDKSRKLKVKSQNA